MQPILLVEKIGVKKRNC